MAKLRPQVRHAGQTSHIFFRPDIAQINQNGTMTEKNGNCRPTIALSCSSGNPVTFAKAIIGVPSAPKATGAVLPINAMPEASNGLKPRPISIAAEMATGVPNPAAPSIKAPKLKAIIKACKRSSLARLAIVARITSNCPVSTVMS